MSPILVIDGPLHHPQDVLGIGQDLHVLIAVLLQNVLHGGGLAQAYLKNKGASQPQGGLPLGGDGVVVVQAVVPAVQGHVGLVVLHRHVQPPNVPGGDIGRVTHNGVEVPQGGAGGLQGVHRQAGNPGVQLVAADILLAHPQGPL